MRKTEALDPFLSSSVAGQQRPNAGKEKRYAAEKFIASVRTGGSSISLIASAANRTPKNRPFWSG
ncbi:hypothetical protein ACRQ5I_00325 [Pseudoramibacter alactolyticus]|jgi:hypothetical protein|uniref:hypothetical protein n=1 Tax=Pseudoramibacter alactolyticus TaxID=113287 RepID=UPI0002F9CF86|nr:hypothetical protein [Pseudoramibacter alactolyticus]